MVWTPNSQRFNKQNIKNIIQQKYKKVKTSTLKGKREMDYLDLEAERLKLDPQEAKAELTCNKCGAEIYEGQDYYFFERDYLCEDCFDEVQSDEKIEARRIAGEDDEY